MGIKNRIELKIYEDFVKNVSQLEAIEFMGLLKILKVSPYIRENEEIKDKSFSDAFTEALEQFSQLSFKKRKEILKIVKQANEERRREKIKEKREGEKNKN